MPGMSGSSPKSRFLIYQAENGVIKIDVRFEDETVWLTQQLMMELLQTTKQNIGFHLKNISVARRSAMSSCTTSC